jgi:uncharacterized protein (DUF2141 family)
MKILNTLIFFVFVSIALIGITGSAGCANIIPPTGGPKDTIPPVLVSAVPKNGTLHFTGKLITLTFDEYVEVKDKEKNLVINPTPKSSPTVEFKLKNVTIKLRDTLQPNTTYTFNFGNAIRDENEGNVIKNFTYVFSTGSYIDSLELSGRVLIAVTGKADSTLIVMLHRNQDDSAVAKERPRYVTTVDTSGYFTFHHLEAGTYRVYALKDEGGSKLYTSKSQLFAFADSPVVVNQNTAPVSMYAYEEEVEKKSTKKNNNNSENKKPSEKDKRLVLQTNISANELDFLDTLDMQFATPLKNFDSTKLRLTDDLYKDISYKVVRDTTNKKFTIFFNKELDTKYHIIADKEFAEDSFGRKLLKIDTISFHTKRESQYGEVLLRFRNLDLSKNPVLQFVQSDVVKFSYRFINKEFKEKLFKPGEYDLRILYDDNKNGIWDPGSFFGKHKQPEKVLYIKINKPKHKLDIKANWDNDTDFTL